MPIPPELVEKQVETILNYLARNGAKVVVWLSGHGGTEDYLAIRKAALTAMRVSDCIIWAGVDAHLIADLGVLDPNPAAVPQGVGGDDPRTHASETFGKERTVMLVDRIATLAARLVKVGNQDPVARSRHRECLAQQVELDEMIAFARARLPAADQPSKEPHGWSEHLEAFRLGDYETAYATGTAVIAKVRGEVRRQ